MRKEILCAAVLNVVKKFPIWRDFKGRRLPTDPWLQSVFRRFPGSVNLGCSNVGGGGVRSDNHVRNGLFTIVTKQLSDCFQIGYWFAVVAVAAPYDA